MGNYPVGYEVSFLRSDNKKEPEKIESLSDGIKWAIYKYGTDILSDGKKLMSILSDMVPTEFCDNIPLLRIALGTNAVSFLLQMYEASEVEREVLEQKAISILRSEAYLADEYVAKIIEIMLSGMDIKRKKENVQPHEQKTIQN